MRFVRWLKALCAWRHVGRSGCWNYWENDITGARTAKYAGGQYGSEALHRYWLTGGDWDWDHYPLIDLAGKPIHRPLPPIEWKADDSLPDGC